MKRALGPLADGTFDLLVLGGGITGAGVALDASLRGFRVALIDKADFASGTSSASSKLVHGGLRYLEHGDFRLVYEALHERRLLLHNAPHLVRPLRFVLPFYSGTRVPPWKWRAGLLLYDLLAGRGNLSRSHALPLPRLLREFPGLHRDGLLGGADYYDAQMDDARLCIEVLKTAAREGAYVANYVEAMAFEPGGVRALDHVGGAEFPIRARVVLNATGPWVDQVCRLAGDNTGPHLRPTKGTHLVTPGRGLRAAFLLLHPDDGRVLFVIPWLGKTLIGTTDTDSDTPADALVVTAAEVDYLLRAHNHYFSPALSGGDVLGSFAGLRPLLRSRPAEPSSRSREFRLFWSPSGLLTAAGGKYTTYRHMAEVITDAVAERLGRQTRCRTANHPLDGAPSVPWGDFVESETKVLMTAHGLGEPAARHLVNRYGRRAADVAAYLVRDPRLAEPLVRGEPDLRAEFVYQREEEMAIREEDCLLRRTRVGLYRPELWRGPEAPLAASHV
ncbi:MAG TPA: glycerol-3-phosphate dehydrogenase [Gemmataceae bacterium]|nr:glycerol-3-phosphate dehydrogenase [Gemmataceae bacterium]